MRHLPCRATMSNRLAKAAMSEGMADMNNHSTPGSKTCRLVPNQHKKGNEDDGKGQGRDQDV